MDYTSRDRKAAWTDYTSQDYNAGEPSPLRAFLLASAADHSKYVYGAIRIAAAKVMLFTSQHAFELKCWGSATLG